MYKIIYQNKRTKKHIVEYGFNKKISSKISFLNSARAFEVKWVFKLFPTPINIWKCFINKAMAEK